MLKCYYNLDCAKKVIANTIYKISLFVDLAPLLQQHNYLCDNEF